MSKKYVSFSNLTTFLNKLKNIVLLKTEQTLSDSELAQVRENLKLVGKDVEGQTFTVDGQPIVANENTEIFGDYANNIAIGQWSIAEGTNTIAKEVASHAEGEGTIAAGRGQTAMGSYNISDTDSKLIVGIGTEDSDRKNGLKVSGTGEGYFASDVYANDDKKLATEEYVENLYKKLNSNTVLGFYCIEDVTIVTNGISKVYPANSNVEVTFIEDDTFEIIPTSNNSIMSLTAFPGALGTYYPWLEGVKQFSNILFDMNDEAMYSKWSQGNQGSYQVQFAQYTNCIFWSDNGYISDVSRRTNYTLYYTSQLPLCYSTIPDNTFKAFYLAFNVNNDPNWGNKAYRDSFAQATWATQVFSYYGARTIGIFGHDDPDFNITLPSDCRGLMCEATAIENAGTFDAINTTNFGAKSGSWRDAFRMCSSLRNLYIKNLKVNLNISWSPINYESIYFIISNAANTNAITISLSPYTYNLLSPSDFELAASKNITIELITSNYVEDRRLGEIANKQNKNIIVSRDSTTGKATMTAPEIMVKVRAGENVYYTVNLQGGTLHPYLEGADTGVFFYSNYIDNNRVVGTGILIDAEGNISTESYSLGHLKDTTIHVTAAERNNWLTKTAQTLTDAEAAQVRENLKIVDETFEKITNEEIQSLFA